MNDDSEAIYAFYVKAKVARYYALVNGWLRMVTTSRASAV